MFKYGTSFTKTCHHTSYPAISPTNPALSAAGKTIVITGGGSGIGLAIATAFVSAGAASIVLIGRTEEKLKSARATLLSLSTSTSKKPNSTSRPSATDIGYFLSDTTDVEATQKTFSSIMERYGRVDVLVNNAGYVDTHEPVSTSDLDDYWRCFEVNVKGPIIVTRAFMAIADPGATVINVSSSAALIPIIPSVSAYAASKIASAKVMECVHYENPAIRVFNLQPGTVETDMAKKAGITDGPDAGGMFLLLLFSLSLLSPSFAAFVYFSLLLFLAVF